MNEVPASVTEDGYTVTSNHESEESLRENLFKPEPAPETPDLSKAAAELGKAGGEATAAKRAEEAPPEGAPEPEAEGEAAEAGRRVADEIARTAGLDKKKQLAHERVEEATKQTAEVRRQLAAERRERERLAAEVARLSASKPAAEEQQKPQARPGEDPEPLEDNFESYAEYIKAAGRWAAREEFRNAQKVMNVHRQASEYTARVESDVAKYAQRIGEAVKTDPQFLERISPDIAGLRPYVDLQPGEVPTTHTVIADEIFGSEQAPALMLYFTEHPDAFQRIASLRTPREIAREMAKVEASLEVATTATSTTRPQVSKAHAPVRPVAGAPPTVNEPPGENSSYEEHKRYYDALDKKRAASRR